MKLAEFIREQQQSCQGEVLEPIIEALSKYLVKELKDRDYAYIRWEYDDGDTVTKFYIDGIALED